MSELLRGTISVIVLVIVISIIYLMIQNYNDRKLTEENPKQDQLSAQEQQDTKTKLEGERDKVDTLVDAMQDHSATEGNTTEKTESPF